jgi:Cu/Ag efflux protein CusF
MPTSRLTILSAAALALLSASALAQQSRLGTVTRLDEANGTIAIAAAQGGTVGSGTAAGSEEFQAQDGLLFNALKEGDRVSFTVEEVGGAKIITKLEKQ